MKFLFGLFNKHPIQSLNSLLHLVNYLSASDSAS